MTIVVMAPDCDFNQRTGGEGHLCAAAKHIYFTEEKLRIAPPSVRSEVKICKQAKSTGLPGIIGKLAPFEKTKKILSVAEQDF